MALTELLDDTEQYALRDAVHQAVAGRLAGQLGDDEYARRLEYAVAETVRTLQQPYLDPDSSDEQQRQTLHTWARMAVDRIPGPQERKPAGIYADQLVNGHPVYRVGDDQYIVWSNSCNAPADQVMTLMQVWQCAITADRLARLLTLGHTDRDRRPQTPEELVAGNQAGPEDTCLTLDALIRAYSDDDFVLQPGDIQPVYTNSWDADDNEIMVWIPWRPGEQPDTLEGVDLRTQVPARPGDTQA